jgi:hypothetical protein
MALGGQLARAYMLTAEHRRAIEVADRVLEAAERADLGAIVADTLVTKGSALALLGRAIEGLAVLLGGQALAEARGLGPTQLRGLINRTSIEAGRDPRAALATARDGLVLARRLGQRAHAASLLGNGVENALRTGDWPWALGEINAALADEHEVADRLTLLQAAAFLHAVRGEPVAGLLDELDELVGDRSDPTLRANVVLAQAMAAFSESRDADARQRWHRVAAFSLDHVSDALARAARVAIWAGDETGAAGDLAALDASGIHGPAIEADRTVLRAGLAALAGRTTEALAGYRDALRSWRDLGLPWDEALAGIDMAMLLDPADPDVAAAVESSRAILERLGARPFLERLDRAQQESRNRQGSRSGGF